MTHMRNNPVQPPANRKDGRRYVTAILSLGQHHCPQALDSVVGFGDAILFWCMSQWWDEISPFTLYHSESSRLAPSLERAYH